MTDDGTSATTHSWLPRWAADSSSWNYMGITAAAASTAPYRAMNAVSSAGSAYATSTVVVSDGTKTYTITRSDLYDDSSDVVYASVTDLDQMTARLQSLNSANLTQAKILSASFEEAVSRTRRYATIVDVTMPNGIRTGSNKVRTFLKVFGVPGTQTVDSVVYIPEGAPLRGAISVTGGLSLNQQNIMYSMFGMPQYGDTSVAQIAADIASNPKNTDLVVQYHPMGYSGAIYMYNVFPSASLETTVAMKSAVSGQVVKSMTVMSLYPNGTLRPKPGASLNLTAYTQTNAEQGTITVLHRNADTATDTVVASILRYGFLYINYNTGPNWRNGTYTFSYGGDENNLACRASVNVRVGAKVTVAASPWHTSAGRTVMLSSDVGPVQPSGSVVFEYATRSGWKAIKSVRLVHGRTATTSWKPGAGTWRVRARFTGSVLNVPTTSAYTATVRID